MKTDLDFELVAFDPLRTVELVRMWRDSFEDAVGIVDPHPIEEQQRYLMTEVASKSTIRIALFEDKVVGLVAAARQCVVQLYVHKSYQRRGLGRRMLDWAKQQSGGTLWLYTFAQNKRARSFYERQGFRAVARGFEPSWKLADVRYEWSAAPPRDGLKTSGRS